MMKVCKRAEILDAIRQEDGKVLVTPGVGRVGKYLYTEAEFNAIFTVIESEKESE